MLSQKDGKGRAHPRCALQLEKSSMVIEDMLDDRQAEPGSAHLSRTGGVNAVEPLSQPRKVITRDPLATISHSNRDECGRTIITDKVSLFTISADRNVAPRAAILDRVIHQILENLSKLISVPEDRGKIRWQGESDPHAAFGRTQLEAFRKVMEKWAQLNSAFRHHVLVKLDSREREQILD